jgi:tripartite-type tricarboxylate transporter receptor subunit TctC
MRAGVPARSPSVRPVERHPASYSASGAVHGLQLNRVPYKGDSEQASDLLGGHIDAGVLSSVASSISSRADCYLAMFTSARVPQFPKCPL